MHMPYNIIVEIQIDIQKQTLTMCQQGILPDHSVTKKISYKKIIE